MLQDPPAAQIVLLDGSETEAQDLADKLDAFGYRIEWVQNPDSLVTHAKQARADYALIRLQLDAPRAEVFAAATELRSSRPDIEILFLCDDASLSTRVEAVRAGSTGFIYAPFSVFDIVDRIEALGGVGQDQPHRVLIVDDDRQVAQYHATILEQANVVTLIVENPAQLLAQMPDFRPELILMDYYMPEIDGRELAAVIRQEPAYDSIPIVFLSAEDNAAMQQKVMQIGGDDFLTKPIGPGHLLGAVLLRAHRFRTLRATMLRDSLTGLLNHTAIKEQTAAALSRTQRYSLNMAFALIDIDHFKQVNDRFGHPVGDQVIRSLSHLLKQRLRTTDLIGRYGGEEFAIALPDTTVEQATNVLNAIRNSFSKIDHPSQQGGFTVTFSCGLTGFPEVDSVEALTDLADQRLYAAKNAGRNQVISEG